MMTRLALHLLAVSLLGLLSSSPKAWAAKKSTGAFTVLDTQPISDGNITLSGRATYRVRWGFERLVGEPVVECDMAWMLPKRVTVQGYEEFGPVPQNILAKVDIVRAKATMLSQLRYNVAWMLRCDLGAIAEPVKVPRNRTLEGHLAKLSKRQRRKAFSFTNKGSPNWSELLFRLSDMTYVDEAQAKSHTKNGIQLSPMSGHRTVTPDFDLNPVLRWLAKKQQAKLDAHTKALTQRIKAQEKRKRALDNGPDAVFWASPEEPETVTQRAQTNQRKQERDKLVRALQTTRTAIAQGPRHRKLRAPQKHTLAVTITTQKVIARLNRHFRHFGKSTTPQLPRPASQGSKADLVRLELHGRCKLTVHNTTHFYVYRPHQHISKRTRYFGTSSVEMDLRNIKSIGQSTLRSDVEPSITATNRYAEHFAYYAFTFKKPPSSKALSQQINASKNKFHHDLWYLTNYNTLKTTVKRRRQVPLGYVVTVNDLYSSHYDNSAVVEMLRLLLHRCHHPGTHYGDSLSESGYRTAHWHMWRNLGKRLRRTKPVSASTQKMLRKRETRQPSTKAYIISDESRHGL